MAEKTSEEVQAEALERAKQANEARNKSRAERLSEIADNNDRAAEGEMLEADGDKLVMKEEPSAEEKEAAAAQQDREAERFLAETQAKALQEEGATAPEATEPQQTQEGTSEPADVKTVNGVTHYLTLVNGKERWLTLEQLRTAAQKVESADEYLKAAAESVRNASGLALQPQAQLESDAEVEALAKLHLEVAMGDLGAARKLAAFEVQQRRTVSPQVVRQVSEHQAFLTAARQFQRDYSDVWRDPKLQRLVVERDLELARENPAMPFHERLAAAGDEVRAWRQSLTGAQPASASADKLERKRQLTNVPSAAARQTPARDEETEESVEDVIQQMAKARGQAHAIVHRGGGNSR